MPNPPPLLQGFGQSSFNGHTLLLPLGDLSKATCSANALDLSASVRCTGLISPGAKMQPALGWGPAALEAAIQQPLLNQHGPGLPSKQRRGPALLRSQPKGFQQQGAEWGTPPTPAPTPIFSSSPSPSSPHRQPADIAWQSPVTSFARPSGCDTAVPPWRGQGDTHQTHCRPHGQACRTGRSGSQAEPAPASVERVKGYLAQLLRSAQPARGSWASSSMGSLR